MNAEQLERASLLFKALGDPARLRILGLLAEEPLAGHQIAARLGLTPPTISHHMRRLTEAGLVVVSPEAQTRIYGLNTDTLRDLAGPTRERPMARAESLETAANARAFFDGERLRQIPASRKKRVVVLRMLLERFEPDREYHEREVNALLAVAHDDYATLRRELVDYGFMTRDKGIYRVATELPERGPTVRQETGNEAGWFADFVATATRKAVEAAHPEQETPHEPR